MAEQASSDAFTRWRLAHRSGSLVVTIMAILHSVLTLRLYPDWTLDAVWFLGAGLGLLLLGLLNLVHVGLEPCTQPTARFVRYANWGFVLFGASTLLAEPLPQAAVIVAGLLTQAVAANRTLPGNV